MKTPHDIITESVAQYGSRTGVDADDRSLDLTNVLDSLALVEMIYKIEAHIGRPLELEQIIDGDRLYRERLEAWIEQSEPTSRKGRRRR
jgi:acyl carrier protein